MMIRMSSFCVCFSQVLRWALEFCFQQNQSRRSKQEHREKNSNNRLLSAVIKYIELPSKTELFPQINQHAYLFLDILFYQVPDFSKVYFNHCPLLKSAMDSNSLLQSIFCQITRLFFSEPNSKRKGSPLIGLKMFHLFIEK